MQKNHTKKSQFHIYRQNYNPILPQALKQQVAPFYDQIKIVQRIQPMFPSLVKQKICSVTWKPQKKLDSSEGSLLRIGCVLSGGQAPGGHNVILGIYQAIKKINQRSILYGFLDGPHGIYSGRYMEIDDQTIQYFKNRGGFDMIRSGRHKIQTKEQFEASLKYAEELALHGLVVIGGDDSNTNAALLAQYFLSQNSKCKVIGCPKTIDGDLKNKYVEVSFGYDTACRTYIQSIGNIMFDTLSTKKYYHFIRLMGRSASHITLQCSLHSQPTIALIGEQINQKNLKLSDIINNIVQIIIKRHKQHKNYGIILVPQGLIQFINQVNVLIQQINHVLAKEKIVDYQHVLQKLTQSSKDFFKFLPTDIANQLLLDRDSHGNVQVAKIQTQKLLIKLIKTQLKKHHIPFACQSHYLGYEGRCAFPTNFDCNYCYGLGYNAALLISKSDKSGLMSCIKQLHKKPEQWQAAGFPLTAMIDLQQRKGKQVPVIKKALVDLKGPMFEYFEKHRQEWAISDHFKSPGPIQFESNNQIPYLVKTQIDQNKFVKKYKNDPYFAISQQNLSSLSKILQKVKLYLPEVLNQYYLNYSDKIPFRSSQIKLKCQQSYPFLTTLCNNFIEIKSKKQQKNSQTQIQYKQYRIGVSFNGRQCPGGHNILYGLLKTGAKIFGFLNGVEGIFNKKYIQILQQDLQFYINQGGFHFLGRSKDQLRTDKQIQDTIKTCVDLKLDGLVLIGATHTLTDAMILSQHLLKNKIPLKVIGIPASPDNSTTHPHLQLSLGFSSTSHLMSSLLSNLMIDASSNTKYWYFIRLMSKQMGHLLIQCALQTMPNIVLIGQQISSKKWGIVDIVEYIADTVDRRAKEGKNYGCVILGEMLLSWVAQFVRLVKQLDKILKVQDVQKPYQKLTPYMRQYFLSMPDFIQYQILTQRQTNGTPKWNEIQTERFLAHLVDQELKRRKKTGNFKSSFAPVCHYFGYQSRSTHPSLLDMHLGFVNGYLASILIQNQVTGYCTTIRNIMKRPQQWHLGAIPLINMTSVKQSRSYGSSQAIIAPSSVNTKSYGFQMFATERQKWVLNDHYQNPGPIQYFGSKKIKIPLLLTLQTKNYYDLREKIKRNIESLQTICGFGADEDLLIIVDYSLQNLNQIIKRVKNRLYDR